MKIYSQTGDGGETSLADGSRVYKNNILMDAIGTVDELNSHLGLVASVVSDSDIKDFVIKCQHNLIKIMGMVAKQKQSDNNIILEKDVMEIETKIDIISKELENLKFFVLPGGSSEVAYCHIARCVCRRTERLMVEIKLKDNIDMIIIKYFNRLSDYLFVAARKIAKDMNIDEIKNI